MSFSPAGAKNFRRGQILKANDLNNLHHRLERLEKIFSGNLLTYNGENGVGFNLPHNIPEFEFIRLIDDIPDDEGLNLHTGLILDQDINDIFFETSEELEFRNLFRCTFQAGKNALVNRFPRGNGEWIIIPKACN